MISKELLKEVTGYDTLEYDGYNIYELAHKCKEWAKKVGFMIESDNMGECRVYPTDENGWILKKEIEFLEYSEPEAILKACEWVLKK